jgi:8-hydroxy-5-deazaflavin:NADPH oxidoreductase
MRIRIFGRGPLAQPIARLAERAGHTVRWSEQTPEPPYNDELLDLVILAGSRNGVEADLDGVSTESLQNLIVVDAITPTQNELDGSSSETVVSVGGDSAWIATMLPEPRIVRAFASVPEQAFTDLLDGVSSDEAPKLAVPLAGDDRDAKALVGTFMREIGIEPFDLGPLSSAEVLDPGGPLWGKALNEVEMLEAVGWLSGDG